MNKDKSVYYQLKFIAEYATYNRNQFGEAVRAHTEGNDIFGRGSIGEAPKSSESEDMGD